MGERDAHGLRPFPKGVVPNVEKAIKSTLPQRGEKGQDEVKEKNPRR